MRIHLDHNATTPLRPEARERWLTVSDALGGNPSGLHAGGRGARAVIDEARSEVAEALGVAEDEICFTSGGTESNNFALKGALPALGSGPQRLVTTAVEHSSILGAARSLAARGHELRLLPVDRSGLPDVGSLEACLGERRALPQLVSIMAANNEVGCVPDLGAIRALLDHASGPRPLFHTDAVQALGRLPVKLSAWGVDLASFSAHKVGGPVGVGVLWCRKGVVLEPLLHGGEQEAGLRAGTEDAAGIAAAAKAISLATREQASYAERVGKLALELWADLEVALPKLRLLGPSLSAETLGIGGASEACARRLPNTLCVRVPDTDGKVLVTRLDLAGIEASAGSACASGSIEPSHVLLAMGHDENEARAGLRLSLGRSTSREECKQAVGLLQQLLAPSHAT